MHALVDQIYRLRELAGRCAGPGLDMEEIHRLNALEARFPQDEGPRRYFRHAIDGVVLFRRGEVNDRVELIDISPDGMSVRGVPAVRNEQAVELTIKSEDGSTSYRFRAEVIWTSGSRLGLRFVGMPIKMRHGPPSANPPEDVVEKIRSSAA